VITGSVIKLDTIFGKAIIITAIKRFFLGLLRIAVLPIAVWAAYQTRKCLAKQMFAR